MFFMKETIAGVYKQMQSCFVWFEYIDRKWRIFKWRKTKSVGAL